LWAEKGQGQQEVDSGKIELLLSTKRGFEVNGGFASAVRSALKTAILIERIGTVGATQ